MKYIIDIDGSIGMMGRQGKVVETIRGCKATYIISRGRKCTYGSLGEMKEEQVKRWLKHKEPEKVVERGSIEIDGVDSEGMYSDGCADDERYKKGAANSYISTSGGGMSKVAGGSSSKLDTY